MGLSLKQKDPGRGMPPLQASSCKSSLLSKLILAPPPLLCIRTLQPPSSQLLCPNGGTQRPWYHQCMRIPSPKEDQQKECCTGRTCLLIPKAPEQWFQSEDIEKKRQRATLLHHRPRVVVHHAYPFMVLQLEYSGLWNSHQELIVNPIEGLGLI